MAYGDITAGMSALVLRNLAADRRGGLVRGELAESRRPRRYEEDSDLDDEDDNLGDEDDEE